MSELSLWTNQRSFPLKEEFGQGDGISQLERGVLDIYRAREFKQCDPLDSVSFSRKLGF